MRGREAARWCERREGGTNDFKETDSSTRPVTEVRNASLYLTEDIYKHIERRFAGELHRGERCWTSGLPAHTSTSLYLFFSSGSAARVLATREDGR
jgi:hypothetical protein